MFKILHRSKRLFFVCLILLFNCQLLIADENTPNLLAVEASNWPSDNSDLLPDPSIKRGILPNGLRYIIKENHEPEQRVAAYLAVFAGSNEEREDQQGVAHFLEHMMFNGTENFSPGSMVEYFQSIGMDFGGDTNAYTSFDRTVYHLILPIGTDKELEIGCKVLADYARGALLLDSEIERERGVIFSEKRSRDSAGYRNHQAYTEFAFKGTRYPKRLPIGTDAVLQSANRPLIKGYYDSWYRPENMVLVLVGDMDIESAEKIVSRKFGQLSNIGEMGQRPEFGVLQHHGVEGFYNYEPDLGKTNVAIETMWDISPEHPSVLGEKKELIRIIGNLVLGYRLQRAQESVDVPYANARYSSGVVAKKIGYASLYAITDGSSWKETIKQLHLTLESAKKFGFTTQEIERAKGQIYSELHENVETEDALHSRVIAGRLVDHIIDGDVYMSPRQEQQLYSPMLAVITVEDIHNGFSEMWGNPTRLISVTGDTNISENASEEIKRYYTKIKETKIDKPEIARTVVFPYLKSSNTQATVIAKKSYPDIDVTSFTFDNGLVFNFKKTDYEPNMVRIAAHFGRGEQDETVPGMALVADDIVNLSGTKTLNLSELETIIAGSSVDLSFRIGKSSNSWAGSALTSDLGLLIQVLKALMLDPGFEKAAYKKVLQRFEMMHNRLAKDIDGAVLYKVQPFWAGGNAHYGLPTREAMQSLNYEAVLAWVADKFDFKDLEISIVGDVNVEQILPLLSESFGALTVDEHPQRVLDEMIKFPAGETLNLNVTSSIEKSRIYMSWATEDFWDIKRTRRLSLIATILEDRVRKKVREQLGASYSPMVVNYASRMHKGYGFMGIELNVESDKEDMLVRELKKLTLDLIAEGVTAEELNRAKQPILTSVYENIKTNQYWLYSVLTLSSTFPQQLIWPSTIVDDIKSISKVELDLLIRKYLQDSKSAVAIIRAVEKEGDVAGEPKNRPTGLKTVVN